MKAVLIERCPAVRLVDVSHDVPPFDVAAGAFALWAGTRDFGPGSVHLAVVDPGVGTHRERLAVRAGGRLYVAPDNGLLDLVLAEQAVEGAVLLERPPSASRTFEGRDVFAPAAGELAAGRRLEELGLATTTFVRLPPRPPSVLWIDRFGNLLTSLKPPVSALRINGRDIRASAPTFGAAPSAGPFHYVGSLGYVEVGVREGRADEVLGARPGTLVEAL